MKAPEVTPRNSVGRAKVFKIFPLNNRNYHPVKVNDLVNTSPKSGPPHRDERGFIKPGDVN